MSSKRRKKIQHGVEYVAVRLFMVVLWLMPLTWVLILGDALGWFAFTVLCVRRKIVLKNLEIAFPEKSMEEKLDIAKRSYQNIAKTYFEYMRFRVLDREAVQSLVTIENPEVFERALSRGKGGVVVAGHFGSWELMGAAVGYLGYPMNFLVGEQHNPRVDGMMNAYRAKAGVKIIQVGMGVRSAIKALRNNEFLVFLSDQDARHMGVFVDFFGRPSSTPQGAAAFALKTGAAILFATTIRLPKGRHRILLDYLTFDHLKGASPENIQKATQAYSSLLEKYSHQYPDHYYWVHRRWKSSPEGGPPNPYK